MDLNRFSKEILNKDIPLNILKVILYMSSNDKENECIDTLCKNMYITKKKLTNEITKTKPIEGYYTSSVHENGYLIEVCGSKFDLLETKVKKAKKESNIKNIDDAVLEIFNYWCDIFNKNKGTNLDTKRINKIKDALKNNSVENCKKAVLGCSKNLWNMGKKDGNTKKYNSIDLIFRNQDKIEGFIDDSELPDIETQLGTLVVKKNVEERLGDNDWFNKRGQIMSQKTKPQKQLSQKETPKLGYNSSEINIEMLYMDSLKCFYKNNIKTENNIESYIEGDIEIATTKRKSNFDHEKFNHANVEDAIIVEEKELMSDKVIDSNEKESYTPLYLKIAKNKNK